MKYVVFDVGGTEIKYSVMDEALSVSAQGTVPTPQSGQDEFLAVLHSIYEQHKAGTEGIAVSMPGIIDADAGFCHSGGALRYNIGQPVAAQLAALCGCPVHIDNDGKCAALAEYTAGSLRGCRNAAAFIIGTGVGGGLIVNGELVRGVHHCAGEFSYVSAESSAWGDAAGLLGQQCSTRGLLGLVRAAKGIGEGTPFNGHDAFALINAGDAAACAALETFAHNVAIQIYNLQMLLDIEKVAIGGGISRQDALLDALRRQTARVFATMAIAGIGQTVEIVRCAFDSRANQIGALQSYLHWRRAQADARA